MGLGSLLFKQGALLNISREQRGNQAQPTSANRDFVAQYLRCLGVNELDKMPEALRGVSIGRDAVKCIEDLMKSTSWDEVFMKFNLETALLEAATKHELQQLFSGGSNQDVAPLSLYGLYNFILSINAIRVLVNNDVTRPMGLLTLVKMTYLIFDIYGELTKRGIIPRGLEIEVWRTRETLIKIMEELFKGDRTITVNEKPLDKGK